MKRRNFIVLSVAGAAALGTSYWYFSYYKDGSSVSLAEPESLSAIWDTETIQKIGLKYRLLYPGEDDQNRLIELLGGTSLDDDEAIAALKLDITNDFISENTILMDGWIIARTEARQCALFSLVQS